MSLSCLEGEKMTRSTDFTMSAGIVPTYWLRANKEREGYSLADITGGHTALTANLQRGHNTVS